MFKRKRRRIRRPSSRKVKRIREHVKLHVYAEGHKGKMKKGFYLPSFSVFKKVMALLCLLLLVIPGGKLISESVFLFFTDGIFKVKQLEIVNSILFAEKEIIKMAGIEEGENIFDVKITEIKNDLEKNENIEKAVVIRKIPNTIRVKIYEKIPRLVVVHDNQEYFFDKEGSILSWEKERVRGFLPEVEGVHIKKQNLKDNKQINILKSVGDILDCYSEFKSINENFSLNRVTVVSDYEIILQTSEKKVIRVRQGDNFYHNFLKLESVLNDLLQTGRKFTEIDLRFRDVVVL